MRRRHPRAPRTRGECINGPRPCPWVGCSEHLLLYVDGDGALFVAKKRSVPGRRGAFDGAAPEAVALVEAWMDAAVEMLAQLEDSCALDVADRGEHTCEEVGELTGVTKQFINNIERAAMDGARFEHWEGEARPLLQRIDELRQEEPEYE